MTYSPSGGRPLFRESESGQQRGQVLARKRPLEGSRGGLVSVLEPQQRGFEGGEVGEVAGRQHLALHNRKVDLDLIQPARMNRREDRDQVRPLALQSIDRLRPAVSRPVVQNPEDASSGSVRLVAP